jgi:hypothetical protein
MPVPRSAAVSIFWARYVPLITQPGTSALGYVKSERTQVNRQDDPNVIRVSVLRHAIGYVAARSLRYRHASSMTVWGGGNNVITSQGKHLATYQRGKQRLPSLSYYWPDSLPGH